MTTSSNAGSAAEKTFLDAGNVKVTSARLVVPGQTFAMSGVTSVKHWRTPRKWLLGTLLLVIGLPMFFSGINMGGASGSAGPIVIGLIIAGLGARVLWRGRPQSQVRLSSASGETKAFTSHDDDLVRRVVAAVSDAIIYRG